MATGAMTLVLFFLTLENAVVVASIGATSFIIFAMPNSITAKPRNVVGGQLTGLISGALCSILMGLLPLHPIFIYSVAVGISIFIMVVIDMEHPPAAGTALGVTMTGFSWSIVLAVLTSVGILALIHHFFKRHIRDLV